MSVTTPTSPEIQARLKAAVACLNLSLEAELTQYRCHRLVQSLSPFANLSPSESETVVSEANENLPLPTSTPTEPVPPAQSQPVDLEPTCISRLEVDPEDVSETMAPVNIPEDESENIRVEQAFHDLAWSVPIAPEPPPAPAQKPIRPTKDTNLNNQARPPASSPTESFSESPTTPRPVENRLTSELTAPIEAPPTEKALVAEEVEELIADEPDVDEVWFDLGDFQPFSHDFVPPGSQASQHEELDPTLASPQASVPATMIDDETLSPNTYLDSAAALLENVPELEQLESEPEPSTPMSRWFVMLAMVGGLVSTAAAIGFIWWQTRPQPLPTEPQTEAQDIPRVLPPGQVPSPVPMVASESASTRPTTPILNSPGQTEPSEATNPTFPLTSPAPTAQPLEKTDSAQAAVQAMPTPDASPLVAPPGSSQFFYVVTHYQQVQDLAQARQAIPNAYLVDFPEGVMIQFAAFEDEPSALFLVDSLKSQGIQAKVRAPEAY